MTKIIVPNWQELPIMYSIGDGEYLVLIVIIRPIWVI